MPYGPAGSASATPTPPTSCSTSPAWNRPHGSGRASCCRGPTSRGNRATTSPCRKARQHCGTATTCSSSTPRAARGRATTSSGNCACAPPTAIRWIPHHGSRAAPSSPATTTYTASATPVSPPRPTGANTGSITTRKKIRYTTGGRDVRLQRFDFDAAGNPRFGQPAEPGPYPMPSGTPIHAN